MKSRAGGGHRARSTRKMVEQADDRQAIGSRNAVSRVNTDPNNVTHPTKTTSSWAAPSRTSRRPDTAAEVLGKALFWDMQVGSDGGPVLRLVPLPRRRRQPDQEPAQPEPPGEVISPSRSSRPNQDVSAADFPFHKLANPDIPGEPMLNPGNVESDANDVMSSMGVKFRQFVDIPAGAFRPSTGWPPSAGSRRRDRPDSGFPGSAKG